MLGMAVYLFLDGEYCWISKGFSSAEITNKVKEILEKSRSGDVPRSLDYEVESLVMDLYEIDSNMKTRIWNFFKEVQAMRIIRELFD